MRIYLIRHGETDWNRKGLLQGQQDIPLNENGIALAQKTAKGMREDGISLDKIYSSPLLRAYETAQILASYLTDGAAVIADDRLKEMNFYDHEGQIYQGLALDSFIYLPGIEPFEAVRDRTMNLIWELIQDPSNAEQNILISTHGVALQSIMAGVYGGTLPEGRGVSSNCGVTILKVEGECDRDKMLSGEFGGKCTERIIVEQENKIYY